MPFYDYLCEANGKTIEVYHPMAQCLKTWGEVCSCAKIDPGKTPSGSPVIRLISQVNPAVFRLKGLDKDAPSRKLEL